ncbi:MAG: GNAT family N-acetyltransferase [Pseudomonadales bacterium]|nr:GNAT family N-acetyltransferase [Pseudomonadales bacterium]
MGHHTQSLPVGVVLPDWRPVPYPVHQLIVGQYCVLEPLDVDQHARDLYQAHAEDAEAVDWTYLPYGPFDNFSDYLACLTGLSRDEHALFFAIIDSSRHQAVGLACFQRIEPATGVLEVAHVKFSPTLKKSPAATEAMYLMMRHAFATGYRRYEWKCDSCNQASRQAAQRLGFVFEGIFRQATVYKGRNRDTAWYSVLDSEWPTLEQAFKAWLAPANFDQAGQQHQRLADFR